MLKTKDYVSTIIDLVILSAKAGNSHLTFLSERISRELHDKSHEDSTDYKKYHPLISHRFFLANKKLDFLPVNSEMDIDILSREVNEMFLALESGTKKSDYLDRREKKYHEKDSWIVKKCLSVPHDLTSQIRKISEKYSIPFTSLRTILNLISSNYGAIEINGEVIGTVKYIDVLVPETVISEERDKLIIEVWRQLYDLLLECMSLIIMMGAMEYIRFCYYYKYKQDYFISFLLDTAVYYESEDRILSINDTDELMQYIQKEFLLYEKIFPFFIDYLYSRYRAHARKHSILLKIPIESRTDQISAADMGTAYREGETETVLAKSESVMLDPEFYDYMNSLSDGVMRKIIKGLLSTYKLRGNIYNLIKYLGITIKKQGLSVVDEHYDKVTKAKYNLSSRSLRRYKSDLKSGKVEISSLTDDTSDVKLQKLKQHIDEIRENKHLRQQHHLEGYLSQRKLINLLRDENFIRRFNKKTGLNFEKHSSPTLIKKLQHLIQQGKITVKKTKSAYHYAATPENIRLIISEIINISK